MRQTTKKHKSERKREGERKRRGRERGGTVDRPPGPFTSTTFRVALNLNAKGKKKDPFKCP
jgi:hypothetical protein